MAVLYSVTVIICLCVIGVLFCLYLRSERKYNSLRKKTDASKDVAELYNDLETVLNGDSRERFNNSLRKLQEYRENK